MIYGSTATHSGDAALGVQSHLFYYALHCASLRGAGDDAAWKAVCETLGRLDKWNTYCIMTMPDHIHLLTAPSQRELKRCCFSEMVQALVQRIIPCTRKMAMAAGRL